MRLQNRVAVVSGGANGIGRAICILFAHEGAAVVIGDRDAHGGAECRALIEEQGGRALFQPVDVTRETDIQALVQAAAEQFGGIDILVNCAAIGIAGSVVDTEPARWERVLDVNLSSVYQTCRHAIPHMQRRGGGAIVNISSIHGLRGWPRFAAYAASKAGIIGLTRQIAVDFAEHNIRANAISPGQVLIPGKHERHLLLEPELMDYAGGPIPKLVESLSPRTPSGERPRLYQPALPEDIASVALFFASDDAAQVTGQNLVVDGGASARGIANNL